MEENELRITFLRKRLTYKKGQVITFNQNDINVLVGDNGAGKTTLIDLLNDNNMNHFIKNGFIQVDGLQNQKGFKSIAEGFRVQKSQFVDSRKEVYIKKLNQKSHGEAWKIQLEKLKTHITPDCLIILDEPETALSIRSQVDFCEWMIKLKKENPKIGAVIATHSPIIQELIAETVIEVPSGKRIRGEEYVRRQNEYIERVKQMK